MLLKQQTKKLLNRNYYKEDEMWDAMEWYSYIIAKLIRNKIEIDQF